MNICRVKDCGQEIWQGFPGEKEGLCLDCFEELEAQKEERERRARKNRPKDKPENE